MFVLKAHIEIGNYTFDQVYDLRITRTVDWIGDTAVIQLPAQFVLGDKNKSAQHLKTTDAIQVGQAVRITIGYKDVLYRTEFVGVVTAVKPNTPVSIHCEDNTWKLRHRNCNKNFRKTTLQQILQYITQGLVPLGRIPALKIYKCLFKSCSGLQALKRLKEDYGLYLYLDDRGQLTARFPQDRAMAKPVTYQMGDNIITHDLEFKSGKAIKCKVKVIGFGDENQHITAEAGDSGGAQRTYHRYDVTDQVELKKIAESKLEALKYDGYRGTLTSFFAPLADRGMIAHLIDEAHPQRGGHYFIPRADITYGTRGVRRKVELGIKVR